MTQRYDWTHGEVAVVGLGRSGTSVTTLLRRLGARVYASDASTHLAIAAQAASLQSRGADVQVGGR